MTAAADQPVRPGDVRPSTDVSRETHQALRQLRPPVLTDKAMGLVGSHLHSLIRFAQLLAGPGAERGLIGPRETERLWDRHLLNCAVVSELIDPGAHVDDVGSGPGLPGMVLALVRPDLEVTLVEPLLRRSTFLLEAVDELGVSNVRVVRVRAEDRAREVAAGGLPPADVATARAVAPLGQLAAWCLPLLRPGGSLLALKGAAAQSEVDAAESELRAAGAARVELLSVGHGVVDPPTTVVRVVRQSRQVARTRPR